MTSFYLSKALKRNLIILKRTFLKEKFVHFRFLCKGKKTCKTLGCKTFHFPFNDNENSTLYKCIGFYILCCQIWIWSSWAFIKIFLQSTKVLQLENNTFQRLQITSWKSAKNTLSTALHWMKFKSSKCIGQMTTSRRCGYFNL